MQNLAMAAKSFEEKGFRPDDVCQRAAPVVEIEDSPEKTLRHAKQLSEDMEVEREDEEELPSGMQKAGHGVVETPPPKHLFHSPLSEAKISPPADMPGANFENWPGSYQIRGRYFSCAKRVDEPWGDEEFGKSTGPTEIDSDGENPWSLAAGPFHFSDAEEESEETEDGQTKAVTFDGYESMPMEEVEEADVSVFPFACFDPFSLQALFLCLELFSLSLYSMYIYIYVFLES